MQVPWLAPAGAHAGAALLTWTLADTISIRWLGAGLICGPLDERRQWTRHEVLRQPLF